MLDEIVENLFVGIRRRWKRASTAALAVAGSVWLVTEIVLEVWPSFSTIISDNPTKYLSLIAILSLGAFLAQAYEPLRIILMIPTTPNKICVKYGDIFADPNKSLIIPVNEFFDYELGQQVSPTSVHGGFINSIFLGDTERFRVAVDRELDQEISIPTQRPGDRNRSYPIGTIARVPLNQRLAILVAISKTDIATSKASTSVDRLWVSMEKVFQAIRDYGDGQEFLMPLIGNGRSNLNLPPQHILRLLVLAVVTFARKEGLGSDLTIVVPRACLPHLDLVEIKRDWGENGI